tara:strand:+ start:3717 stop:3968 length:252 start_codon:yes stop_codon:yes gene_type:complete
MVVTSMKELCAYVENKRKQVAKEHRLKNAHEGYCSGLTAAEYNRVRTPGKKSFGAKARKFTHNRMWKYQKRYSVEQLKQIVKQ